MPVYKLNDVFAGRYELIELIGEGGFSEVWKARDQMAEDAVIALKIYAPEEGLDDLGVQQFRREFSLTHNLSHPHLLKIYHFDICEGSPYLIMPYCSFGSLNRLLEEEGSFSERQVALIMCQIGSALEELHRQDPPILHQDIKPDNILLSQPEFFLLGDFGISSRIIHTTDTSTSEEKILTVAYAPPERFDRNREIDPSADIFSLGVTLYEMCTKIIPWGGSGGQSLQKGGVVPDLPERYSADLNKLLQDCMSPNPEKRPSAAELNQRGRHFLITGEWGLTEEEQGGRTSSTKKILTYGLGAAAAVTVLVVGGYFLYLEGVARLPDALHQKVATTSAPDQEVDSIVDKLLEEELKVLARRTVELEEANKRLKEIDSTNKARLENQEKLISRYQNQGEGEIPSQQGRSFEVKSTTETEKVVSRSNAPATSSSKPKPKEDHSVVLSKEIEQQLNKISDPEISSSVRTAWKQETLDLFADGVVRILDETEGTSKQYSASIFLNLLFNVPHHIEVKGVKSDENKKITELRLKMTTRF